MAKGHRYDYYTQRGDMLAHNEATDFPLRASGDSWEGSLCGRHRPEARARFGATLFEVTCTNPNCPAQCSICNLEFAPREQQVA